MDYTESGRQLVLSAMAAHHPRRGNGRPRHPPLNDGAVPLFSLFGSFHLIFQPLTLCRGNPEKSLAVFRGGTAKNQCSSFFILVSHIDMLKLTHANCLAILASFSSVFVVSFLHNATDTLSLCQTHPPHHHHDDPVQPPPTSPHPAIQPVPASSCIGRCLFLYFLFALS